MVIAVGSSVHVFVATATTGDKSHLMQDTNQSIFQLLVLAGVAAVSSYLQNICWMISGENISNRIREAYLSSLLKQDIQYLENIGSEHIMTALTSHINIIQDTMSQKTSLLISSSSTFIAAFIVALIQNWKLAIMIGAIQPIWTIPTAVISVHMARNAQQASKRCSQGHIIASEVITQISTVRSLGIHGLMAKQYDNFLRRSERFLHRRSFWLALIHGWSYLLLYLAYSFAFWMMSDNLDIGIVVTLLFSIVIGMLALRRAAQCLESFTTAMSVSKHIFKIIDRARRRNPSLEPRKWTLIDGDIMFEDVTFSYASRPNELILNHFDLYIPEGKTTAIVGSSGSGKSAITGLLERFYHPTSGCVSIDALPIEAINLSALRSQMSLVSQEPNLLSMSIYENVRLGLLGTPFETARPWIQRRLVVEACKLAGISDFIKSLPRKYDTHVEPKGTSLSSSQKRLLAFARATIRNPRILILDEPTSNLDRESEWRIQGALERFSMDRTVIILTQRLNTIRTADSIAVIDQGRVIEQGTHDQLFHHKGAYFSLFQAQAQAQAQSSASSPQIPAQTCASSPQYTPQSSPRRVVTRMPSIPETSRWSNSTGSLPVSPVSTCKSKFPKHSTISHLLQILQFNLPSEKYLMLLALLAVLTCAAVGPVQAFLLAKMISLFSTTKNALFFHNANLVSLAFLIIAVIKCVAHFTATFALGVCAEKMIFSVRSQLFRNFLQKELEWFHESDHTAANLIAFLSQSCSQLAGFHGVSLVVFVEMGTNVIASVLFSLIVSSEYAIVIVAVVPLVVITGYLRLSMRGFYQKAVREWHGQEAVLAGEAVGEIRTMAALTRERQLLQMYRRALRKTSRSAAFSILKSSFIFSVAYATTYLVNAFAIWYGATLFSQGRINLYQYFAVYFALAFGAHDTFDLAGPFPDFALAKAAADRFMELNSKQDESIETTSQLTNVTLPHDLPCVLTLENLTFAHRSLRGDPILSNITMTIHPYQRVALLGPPGSGKTTLLSLLARLHPLSSGTIKLSGFPIATIASPSYNHLVALIPAEPVLFSGSIRFNLLFDHTSRNNTNISQHVLEIACRQANILDFIESLPYGFETQCNSIPLSMGQKQRLVIARALVRNPKVLLLDDVTEGLSEVEKREVMVAVESAVQGRTCVSVVGRLNDILGVDFVYVLERGRVIESGSPLDILQNRGILLPGLAR